MTNKAVIALGSNIEPEKHIPAALKAITNAFSVVKKSQFIYTEPVGYKNQPDFLNGVVLIESASAKNEIISTLKHIENNLGRERNGNKNGPRKIDLDLVWFNDRIEDKDVFERDFLRCSIMEVLPGIELKL